MFRAAKTAAQEKAAKVRTSISDDASGLFQKAKTSAKETASKASTAAQKAGEKSRQFVRSVSDAKDAHQIKQRAVVVRKVISEFDWVAYNEKFFRDRRLDRDGMLAYPKEAWEAVSGRRRRILKKINKGNSTASTGFTETTRGFVGGAALGLLGTAVVVSALPLVVVPSMAGTAVVASGSVIVATAEAAAVGTLVAGTVGGLAGGTAMAARSSRRASSVLKTIKQNDKEMAEIFDGIVASLAARYDQALVVGNSSPVQPRNGVFQNQWGTLGADTVSAKYGGITLWASTEGLRVRVVGTEVKIMQGRGQPLATFVLVPSLGDFVILNELGSLPKADVEAIAAMMTILSAPRGAQVAKQMTKESKELLVGLFRGGERITFDIKDGKQRTKNLLLDGSGNLHTVEYDADGSVVTRFTEDGDCVIPLAQMDNALLGRKK